MDWKTHLDAQAGTLADYRRSHVEAGRGFTAMHRAAMAPGALGTKDKELMALAIGVAQRCVDCIGFHVQAAAKAGATRDEIAEVVAVNILMGGGPAYMYGVKALEAYDQLVVPEVSSSSAER